jgi:hypothetical protein
MKMSVITRAPWNPRPPNSPTYSVATPPCSLQAPRRRRPARRAPSASASGRSARSPASPSLSGPAAMSPCRCGGLWRRHLVGGSTWKETNEAEFECQALSAPPLPSCDGDLDALDSRNMTTGQTGNRSMSGIIGKLQLRIRVQCKR